MEKTEIWHSASAIAKRYGVVIRTVDRWEDRGVLPPATWINGRRYWSETSLQTREREHTRAARSAPGVTGTTL